MLFRSRHELNELKLIELRQKHAYSLAKLQSQAADSEEEAKAVMQKANMANDADQALYDEQRAQLPTGLQRLTQGYEMRTY